MEPSRLHCVVSERPVPGWTARALMGAVRFYRLFFKAWLGSACRFEPTCSAYALEALDQHGAAAGAYLAATRLLRCHPGCAGGCDPVPQRPSSAHARQTPATTPPVHVHAEFRKTP